MSDLLRAMDERDKKRVELTETAYNELIDLVCKHGNRRLKDQMWALVKRTAEVQQEANGALTSAMLAARDRRLSDRKQGQR